MARDNPQPDHQGGLTATQQPPPRRQTWGAAGPARTGRAKTAAPPTLRTGPHPAIHSSPRIQKTAAVNSTKHTKRNTNTNTHQKHAPNQPSKPTPLPTPPITTHGHQYAPPHTQTQQKVQTTYLASKPFHAHDHQ